MSDNLTVLYDRDCGACSHTARVLTRLDTRGSLDFAAIQTAGIPGMPARDRLMESLHVRDDAGRWFAGAEAGVEISRRLPVLWPLGFWARLPLGKPILDLMYRAVANNRHTISRVMGLKVCKVPARRE
ncbi:MAG: hypothetical protein QOJ81_2281 [Chloroflexota bacterium]|jgi:predicted DCC family thiol-disulfide oxidoreductase YuxK|nr:hypothetical protein [Chloroflexota bacterium]